MSAPHKCPICKGSGIVQSRLYDTYALVEEREDCRSCDGSGVVWDGESANTFQGIDVQTAYWQTTSMDGFPTDSGETDD